MRGERAEDAERGSLGRAASIDTGQGVIAECFERAKRATTEAMASGGSERSTQCDQARAPEARATSARSNRAKWGGSQSRWPMQCSPLTDTSAVKSHPKHSKGPSRASTHFIKVQKEVERVAWAHAGICKCSPDANRHHCNIVTLSSHQEPQPKRNKL